MNRISKRALPGWRSIVAWAAGAALAGCGGGNGGGNAPSIPVEPPVVLGQAGPGDPQNYLPMTVGNLWHFSAISGGLATGTPDDLVALTGTQLVNGVTAIVMSDFSDGLLTQDSVVKDPNGLAVIAADPTDDALTRSLIPYWELRFPLQAGSSSTQLVRDNLDFGQDLDGDGRNETVSLHSELSVAGTEAVSVPAGDFSAALRVNRTLSMSVHMSRDGSTVVANENDSAWFVPNLGWVRRTSSLTLLGNTSTRDEQLDAYVVGGTSHGLQVATGAVVNGSVAAGASSYWLWPAQPAGRYTATLGGLSADADLSVSGLSACSTGSGVRSGTLPEDCSFSTTGTGPILVRVKGNTAANYTLSLAPAPVVVAPVNESASIALGVPTVGQVAARGTSSYASTGLAAGRYTVGISGLDQDADLHVYADNTYSMELGCTLRAVGDVLPLPEDCTLDVTNGLYFRVGAGELNTVGASYLIVVSPAP